MQAFVRRAQEYSIPGYPAWLASLLHARGIDTAEAADAFLSPSIDSLHPPEMLAGVPQAVQLIRGLGARHARAVVYGDYDVDGLCASVIIWEALQAVGLKAIIYIPDRHQEGYGLNEDAVRKLAPQAELLLTVDCGITAVDGVALARELGMQVIVTDHHQPPQELPPADVLINPLLGEYPFPSLCGAATAWKLSWALCGRAFAMDQIDLCALATIADMVPLLGENRVIAYFGLQALAVSKRPGLQALKAQVGLEEGEPVSADRVSFGLAPRLNAGGRLTTAQDALALLQAKNPHQATTLALTLGSLNTARQEEERRMLEEAETLLAQRSLLHRHTIVLCREGWNKGVVGLTAGKLAEKYGLPTLVLSREGDSCAGSGRSAGGIDLHQALVDSAEVLSRFGGHKQAAGLTLSVDRLPRLEQLFEAAVVAQLEGRPLYKQVVYDAPLSLDQVTLHTVQQLESMAPFGVGNPTPTFLLENVTIASARSVGAGSRHLKLSLVDGMEQCDSIAFGMGDREQGLPPQADAIVRVTANEYRGRLSVQCQVSALRAGTVAFRADGQAEALALVQDLQDCLSNTIQVVVSPWQQEDVITGYQGTLLVCRCFDTAQALHRRYPAFETVCGQHSDPRGGHTILYRTPLHQVAAPFERVIFCDGLVTHQEAALAVQRFPGAVVSAASETPALTALRAEIRLSVEDMREIYRLLRSDIHLNALPWSAAKRLAAALVLAQLQLVVLEGDTLRLLPMRKCDPAESALYRWLA